MRSGMKKSLWLAGALLLGACGGTEAPTPPEDTPAVGESQAALGYDESIHCLVSSSMIRCASGMYAYAQWSDELGSWYIERNACGPRGPIICPL
ncbi:hypothetical protein [Myxococcus stipitatus]|uniref:hypothetical protein n=1 Tax=Myxococcus stipitatus TaxID=83455 RepID=UPI0030D4DC8C